MIGVTEPAPVPGKAVFTYQGHTVELLAIDEGDDDLEAAADAWLGDDDSDDESSVRQTHRAAKAAFLAEVALNDERVARTLMGHQAQALREATELTARAQPIIVHNNEQQILGLKREADKLFAKYIEDVVLLQALTEELRPETRELIKDCTDFQQLLRRMLHAKEII